MCPVRTLIVLVRKGGLEPPCPCGRSHLKAVRLPISPLPLLAEYYVDKTSSNPYLKLMAVRHRARRSSAAQKTGAASETAPRRHHRFLARAGSVTMHGSKAEPRSAEEQSLRLHQVY